MNTPDNKYGDNTTDLCKLAEFSATGPVKKDLIKTAGSNIVLVCLESGQVISPHPEPYAVVFVILLGEGTICSGAVEHAVKPRYIMSVGKDEDRRIRCNRRMVILASEMMYEEIRPA